MTRQEAGMHVTFVHVRVLPARLEAFLEASRANHEGSVREPGCLRFDMLRDPADPTHFLIYEVFVDEDVAAAHKATTHYLGWRDRVAPMMAEPRHGDRWDAVLIEETPRTQS
jgi:(4S)-4-hydroxy-5-phosphonooxypentane-2,3-dione isomerase